MAKVVKTFRIPPDLWTVAQAIARLGGTDVTAMVVDDLTDRVLLACDAPDVLAAMTEEEREMAKALKAKAVIEAQAQMRRDRSAW